MTSFGPSSNTYTLRPNGWRNIELLSEVLGTISFEMNSRRLSCLTRTLSPAFTKVRGCRIPLEVGLSKGAGFARTSPPQTLFSSYVNNGDYAFHTDAENELPLQGRSMLRANHQSQV